MAWFAIDPDISAALFDDPVDGGEAQAGTASAFLSGEERLEDLRFSLRVHAGTGVTDSEHHVTSGCHAFMIAAVASVQIDVGGFEDQFAAVRHGVAGVDHQVHNDLFDLARIGFDRAQATWSHDFDLNIFANQAAKHLVEIENEIIEIDHFWQQHLFAAESEQVAAGGRGGLWAGAGIFDL